MQQLIFYITKDFIHYNSDEIPCTGINISSQMLFRMII